jgi:paraquat-inducible protein A
MKQLKLLLLILHIISLILLFFGLTLDMLQIDISAHFIIDLKLFQENKNIIGAIGTLWNSSNYLPFFLILLFGIIIPIVKAELVFYLLFSRRPRLRYLYWISYISKWAMADVFAISIFIAYLGANAMENTKAILLPGFYFFTAYVLLSGVVSLLLNKIIAQPSQAKE